MQEILDKVIKEKSKESVLRPVIKYTDEINQIANKLHTTPTALTNFCLKAFIEVCNQYIPVMESDIKKRYIDQIFK